MRKDDDDISPAAVAVPRKAEAEADEAITTDAVPGTLLLAGLKALKSVDSFRKIFQKIANDRVDRRRVTTTKLDDLGVARQAPVPPLPFFCGQTAGGSRCFDFHEYPFFQIFSSSLFTVVPSTSIQVLAYFRDEK